MGGETIFSLFGAGIAEKDISHLKKEMKESTKTRLKRLNVLIVEEVSLLGGLKFSKFAELASFARDSAEPWGGIQVTCLPWCYVSSARMFLNGLCRWSPQEISFRSTSCMIMW